MHEEEETEDQEEAEEKEQDNTDEASRARSKVNKKMYVISATDSSDEARKVLGWPRVSLERQEMLIHDEQHMYTHLTVRLASLHPFK